MQLNTLYELIDGSVDAMIEVVGGTVRFYVWTKEPTSSPISADYNAYFDVVNTEMKALVAMPRYIYAVQQSGTTTDIHLSGCRVEGV